MNLSRKKIYYLKLVSAILVAVFVVNVLGKDIFLANTPRIRQDAGVNLITRVKRLIGLPGQFIARLFEGKSLDEELKDIPFQPVGQGIYAKEKENKSIKLYKEKETQWLIYEFDYKGKHYSIRYSASDGVPNVTSLERMLDK